MSAVERMIAGISEETISAFCREHDNRTFYSSNKIFHKMDNNASAFFPAAYRNVFKSFSVCGYSETLNLFVFLIRLDSGKDLAERSCRRLQFDYAKTILKKDHGNYLFHDALTNWLHGSIPFELARAIFVFADEQGRFRFSLVENLDTKEESPKRFRRYTFYVDQKASNRTFRDRMNGKWTSFDEVKKAFSVERLSDEFFDEYKRIYQAFVEYATGESEGGRGKRAEIMDQFAEFGDGEKAFRDYVKKMMGRLVFLQFLQKKGWLGVLAGNAWGNGDKEYMKKLFESKTSTVQQDFLETVLEPLFFDSLNTDRSMNGDIAADVLSLESGKRIRIPYLNGGLFEKDTLDQTKVQFPAEYFAGLFETFERFNFTIDENDPNDAEIGVDPEMLGRIFENLLEDNKDKGAFYTPKEIVNYMCQESLIQYLGDTEENRKLVAELDASGIPDGKKDDLIEKLKTVKICDPAIGSGAFPMGMLNLLYRLRINLGDVEDTSSGILQAKKEIIQNNIYGVDIEPGAVDIARLRFWLSIVVDEDTPTPLPNFDYKIMQGNSLVEQFLDIDLSKITLEMRSTRKEKELTPDMFAIMTDEDLTPRAMQELMKYYYSIHDPNLKHEISERLNRRIATILKQKVFNSPAEVKIINNIDWELKPFFLWHTYFMDVFNEGGFDIVIGNPPYVSTKGRSSEEVSLLESVYGFADDLYYHFILLGYELLKPNGIQTMITSDTYFTTLTKSGLREELLKNTLLQLVHWGHDIFDSAMVSTATFISQKRRPTKTDLVHVFDVKGRKSFQDGIEYCVSQDIFKTSINSAVFVPSPLNLQINNLFADRHRKLLKDWWEKIETSRKIAKNAFSLSNYRNNLRAGTMTIIGLVTDGGQGLATANNGKFVGVLSHTKAAANIRESRIKKLDEFNRKKRTNYQMPRNEQEIWQLFDNLKLKHGRDIFGQGYIFRIVPDQLIADVKNLSPKEKEFGISGERTFVPYDKGDKEGNRWYLETPYLIDWSRENVSFLKSHSGQKGQGMPVVRNPKFYFKEGFCYSDIKTFFIRCRQKGISVHDVKSMSLFPLSDKLPYYYIISVINSHFTATVVYNFLNNTPSFQMNDCRMLPIIVPTESQLKECKFLFDRAVIIQKDYFAHRISPDVRDKRLQEVQDSIDELIYGIYGIETQEYLAHTNTVYSVSTSQQEESEKKKGKMLNSEDDDDARE